VTTWSRPWMKTSAARPCRTWSRLPGPWNEFAAMEWPAYFQAPGKIFRSFSTLREFRVRPGAGGKTFIRSDLFRSTNS